jgi:hypothetical protein
MNESDPLTPEDLSLVELVLGLHPDFEFLVLCARHARRHHLEYPLEDLSGLEGLFPEGGVLVFRGHSVSFAQVVEFLPSESFPIEDEASLIRKMMIANQRHTLFAKRKAPKPESNTVLHDPALYTPTPSNWVFQARS